MNILKMLHRIFMLSLMSQVDGDGAGGGSDEGGSDGSDGGADWSDEGGSDGGDDKDDWKSGSEWDSANDKFTRWKISQAKKEAAKQVVDWKTPDAPKEPKKDFTKDEDFQALVNQALDEKLKWFWLDKLSKIDDFESKLEKDGFFNQFKEAGKDFSEYWMSIDPQKWGEILADIEENWFTPAQLILLQNADFIMWKMKGLPRSPTSTDSWAKPKVDTSKMGMMDRIKMMREKHQA